MAIAPRGYDAHLPEIFRVPDRDGASPFLPEFLKVFEALLSGRDDAAITGSEGLDALLARFPDMMDAALAPLDAPSATPGAPLQSAFLDYLASWAALTLDQNWDLEKKREWTRRVIPFYKRRGTRVGIQEYLDTFVDGQVTVEEPDGGITLGVENTTLGVDTYLADAPAYFFRVRIHYGFAPNPFDFTTWNNLLRSTGALVDREKPAHTYYHLIAESPGFIINVRSTISVDTLIWETAVIHP